MSQAESKRLDVFYGERKGIVLLALRHSSVQQRGRCFETLQGSR